MYKKSENAATGSSLEDFLREKGSGWESTHVLR